MYLTWLILLSGVEWVSSRFGENRTTLRRLEVLQPVLDHKSQLTQTERYRCTREARLDGRCRWCNRDVPSTDGVFSTFPPHWQYPGKCQNQAFDVEDTQKCMQGRTFYVIGNSVARQAAFNMVEMLGGNSVLREDQRDQCPKHATTWGGGCHNEIAGVRIEHMYLQFPDGYYYNDRNGFPFFRHQTEVRTGTTTKQVWTTGKLVAHQSWAGLALQNHYYNHPKEARADHLEEIWEDDNCIHYATRDCLAKFFAGSTENDVLIFTLGMVFAITGTEPSMSPGIDYEKWLRHSAAAFRGHLAATFKGQVFRFTNAEYNQYAEWGHKSYRLALVNNILAEEWAPDSSDMPWYTIDQWAINKGRNELYNDRVHFNGVLTHALLTQMLNELCPGGGKTTWLYPKDGNQSAIFDHYMPPATILQVPLAGGKNWYMVFYQGRRHNISDMDTLDGLDIPLDSDKVRLVSNAEVKNMPEGPPLEPCDKSWKPNKCLESVYYKALHEHD